MPWLFTQRLGLGLETLCFTSLLFPLSFMPRRIVLDGEGRRLRGSVSLGGCRALALRGCRALLVMLAVPVAAMAATAAALLIAFAIWTIRTCLLLIGA
jgi:hypothetical protein